MKKEEKEYKISDDMTLLKYLGLQRVAGKLSVEKDTVVFEGKKKIPFDNTFPCFEKIFLEIPYLDIVYAKAVGRLMPRLKIVYTINSKAKTVCLMKRSVATQEPTLVDWAAVINKKGREKKECLKEGDLRLYTFDDMERVESESGKRKKDEAAEDNKKEEEGK
ncbi:hypothetical protein KY362_05185 [Candidatus Woesearchaeota archaeon]|nr:hypothetical protein [Candidatus Woesearchaeota archaeon]